MFCPNVLCMSVLSIKGVLIFYWKWHIGWVSYNSTFALLFPISILKGYCFKIFDLWVFILSLSFSHTYLHTYVLYVTYSGILWIIYCLFSLDISTFEFFTVGGHGAFDIHVLNRKVSNQHLDTYWILGLSSSCLPFFWFTVNILAIFRWIQTHSSQFPCTIGNHSCLSSQKSRVRFLTVDRADF